MQKKCIGKTKKPVSTIPKKGSKTAINTQFETAAIEKNNLLEDIVSPIRNNG